MFVIFVSGCSTLPSRQMCISFLRWSSPSFSLCFHHWSLFLSFQHLRLPAVSLQACYDSKPRIISKRFQDDQTICSNLDVRHNFDANKWVCLQHTGHYKSLFSHPLSLLILHQLFVCLLICLHHAFFFPLCPSGAWLLWWGPTMWFTRRFARWASCVTWICATKPSGTAVSERTTATTPTLLSSSKPGRCREKQVPDKYFALLLS